MPLLAPLFFLFLEEFHADWTGYVGGCDLSQDSSRRNRNYLPYEENRLNFGFCFHVGCELVGVGQVAASQYCFQRFD
jgi:hypothetical protein